MMIRGMGRGLQKALDLLARRSFLGHLADATTFLYGFKDGHISLVLPVSDVFAVALVSHPGLKAQGLCLNSTAVRHTGEGVPLWFQRSTHQGQPTSAPYLPNLVEQATFASPRFWHPPDQRGACNDSADRRTASLCWADWRHWYVHTPGTRGYCSERPL